MSSLKDKKNIKLFPCKWHNIHMDYSDIDFRSKMDFNINCGRITRVSQIKKIGQYFGFYVTLQYIGRERDRITDVDPKVLIYPFQIIERARCERMELIDIIKECKIIQKTIRNRELEKN